jgi:acyl-CoA dehydrogenase
MELTGFTEEQLTVRDAISAITSKFPNTYWQECDQNERDPKEFHAALAKDGWLGIALPEQLGGAGLGECIMFNVARVQATDCEQESQKLQ